jgi:exodeoxyribonuclease VII large subunit
VVIYPVQVQGEGAAKQMVRMLQLANQRNECDVLVLSRGGGSLEDLQAFNDEGLARAIYASKIPLVSGIGHEIDFTIADFVADQRAPTPSAAAELASPDQATLINQLRQLGQRLGLLQTRYLRQHQEQLSSLRKRLLRQHPNQRLQQRAQQLDELNQHLRQAHQRYLVSLQHKLEQSWSRLIRLSPQQRIENQRHHCQSCTDRLQRAMERRLADNRTRWSQLARDLHTLSPLNTLNRGYAIVSREEDGHIIHASSEVERGNRVRARLSQGSLVCRVEDKAS